MTLDSDNRFMGISPGFPGKRVSYNSRVIEIVNLLFSGFRTVRIWHLRKWGQYYYIVLFSPLVAFPLTPIKIRDREWLWMAWRAILRYMFTTTNCHWLTCYLFTVICLLHVMWPAEKCGKRSIANSDPQSGRIFGIRGKSADLPWMLYRRNLNK